MTKRVFYAFILLFFLGACSNFRKIQKSDDLQGKYNAAIKYYEKNDFYKAGVLFEELIPLLKGQEMAEKAQFYYANCQYKQPELHNEFFLLQKVR